MTDIRITHIRVKGLAHDELVCDLHVRELLLQLRPESLKVAGGHFGAAATLNALAAGVGENLNFN